MSNDLVFKYNVHKYRPNGDGTRIKNHHRSPEYFHTRDLGCLCNINKLEYIEMHDVYISNDTYFLLKKEHIEYLKKNF